MHQHNTARVRGRLEAPPLADHLQKHGPERFYIRRQGESEKKRFFYSRLLVVAAFTTGTQPVN